MPLYTFNDNVQVNAPKPIDNRYLNVSTPWVSTAAVNAAILGAYRYLGLTVLIGTTEYWYQSGTADIDLIAKGGGGGGIITADNGLTANVATNVQLGGILIQTTTIDTDGYDFTLSGINGTTRVATFTGVGVGGGALEINNTSGTLSAIDNPGTSQGTVYVSPSTVRFAQSNGVYEMWNMIPATPGDDLIAWNSGTKTLGTLPYSSFAITADNGLTMSTATNVQLGGTLIGTTTIATGGNTFTISSNVNATDALDLTATGGIGSCALRATSDGIAIVATTNGVTTNAINGDATASVTGAGVFGQSTTGVGIRGLSVSGYAGSFQENTASTNVVVSCIEVKTTSTGTSADGLGTGIDLKITSSSGSQQIANRILSSWTTANNATRTSLFAVTGVSNAVASTLFDVSTQSARFYGTANALYTDSGTVGLNATGSITGVLTQSNSIPLWINNITTATNTIVDGILVQRAGAYTGASGVGSQIRFEAKNDTPAVITTAKIISRVTTVTAAAEVSELEFVILKAGAITTTMLLKGTGQVQLNNYGVGTFTGTAAYNLQVDSSGNIIESNSAPIGAIPLDSSQVHTAGATVTVSNGVNVLYVDPASLLANLTITLPATPHTSNLINILFGGTLTAGASVVTTLSVVGNGGQTLVQTAAPVTAAAGNNVIYRWRVATSQWYRIN